MPTPLPEHWEYDRLSGTLSIWNGSFNEEVATKVWSQDELKFKLKLPKDVRGLILDRMVSYYDEIREESRREREKQIQWVIESVRNPQVAREKDKEN